MGQGQIANIKYFRSFRFSLKPEDRVKYLIKIDGKEDDCHLVGEYELLNLSLSGFAFESDQILGPDSKVHLNIKLGSNSYLFAGQIVRATRHREKRGTFTYGVKNLKEHQVDEKIFIEDLVSQFKTKRLRLELINLLVNEVVLDNPNKEDILGLMIGLYSDLKPFDDRGEFLELFMLQSRKVMQSEHVSLYMLSQNESHLKKISLLYPFQLAGRRCFPINNTIFETPQKSHNSFFLKDKQLILKDPFYLNLAKHEGRSYTNVLLTPILNEDREVIGFFECANLSSHALKDIIIYKQYATLIGYLCADLCEKFSVKCPDDIFRETVVNKKKKKNILIGESTHAREMRAFIQRKKVDRQNYLIFGPTGSGKELLARIVHDESAQNQMPFGVVDIRDWDKKTCLKDIFFGDQQKVGKLELYSGGTILLKNIDLLGPKQQEDLIEICSDKYSICFVATTHQSLDFCRKSLNYDFLSLFGCHDQSPISKSLRVFQVVALKERENDLTFIAKYLIQEECQRLGLLPKVLSDHVLKELKSYSWPHNIVELKLAISRAIHEFQSVRVIDRLSKYVMPVFGNCQLQRQSFLDIADGFDQHLAKHELHSLRVTFYQKLCEQLVDKFGSAQNARQLMNISIEQWMEWSNPHVESPTKSAA